MSIVSSSRVLSAASRGGLIRSVRPVSRVQVMAMAKQVISTDKAPAALGPYSQARNRF